MRRERDIYPLVGNQRRAGLTIPPHDSTTENLANAAVVELCFDTDRGPDFRMLTKKRRNPILGNVGNARYERFPSEPMKIVQRCHNDGSNLRAVVFN